MNLDMLILRMGMVQTQRKHRLHESKVDLCRFKSPAVNFLMELMPTGQAQMETGGAYFSVTCRTFRKACIVKGAYLRCGC